MRTRRPWLDRVGAVVGMGCALHCLALPLVVGVLPFVGAALLHPIAEVMLLGTALVLGEDALPGEPWTTPVISLVLATGHLWRAQEARSC